MCIKNGMSKEDAIEKFNNYNATLQTRRATERSSIQNNKNELIRAFTMFGSTAFLQMNKVAQAYKNIMDSLTTKGNRMPAAKDIKALILNLGAANALFVLSANIAKYALGDDDDRDEVNKKMLQAAAGFNLIMAAPFFNELFQNVLNYVEGSKDPAKIATNPLMGVWWKTQQSLKAEDYFNATVPLIELTLGAQLDPAIGLYNGFTEGFDDEQMYQVLGISKSYRPSPNEYRERLIKEGYSPEDVEALVNQDKYLKKLDAADSKRSKEINDIYESLINEEITEKEYDEAYSEIQKEYEETSAEIEEEYEEE